MVDPNNRQLRPPIHRSWLRLRLGKLYYGGRRRLLWMSPRFHWAKQRQTERLPYMLISHATPLYRHLRGEDQELQENKVANLRLAVARLDGIVLYPGETFSYWRLIGKPTRRKGYRDGMVLFLGRIGSDVGGGLCQLSNLIFWMALHSPLTIVERHRHGYDVFPDSNRKQPFGSGATCSYPHIDLMIRNDTGQDIQFRTWLDGEYLYGELRAGVPSALRYEIVERNHLMKSEFWGGYSRHNELYRLTFEEDNLIGEEFILSNHAIMMYAPFIGEGNDGEEPESRGEFNR